MTKSKSATAPEMSLDPALLAENAIDAAAASAAAMPEIQYDENDPFDMLRKAVNEAPDEKDGINLTRFKSEVNRHLVLMDQPWKTLQKLSS